MTVTERLRWAIALMGGIITREDCQQLAREFGYRNINWLFGTRHPVLIRRPDGLRELA